MARKPTGGKPGRPNKADLAARAVARAEATGESVEEAAVAVGGVGKSAVYAHALVMGSAPGASTASGRAVVQAAREVALRADVLASAPPATHAPTLATGAPIERLRAYAAHDGEALAVLERFLAPPDVSSDPRENARRLLANVESDYMGAGASKRGALAEKVVAAIREVRQWFPPAPPAPTPDAERLALELLDGEAVAAIEELVAMAEAEAAHPRPVAETDRRRCADVKQPRPR